MSRIVEYFNQYFEHWGIALPREAVERRLPGAIFQRGWAICCCFGEDDRGAYMDFYATNRMTNDRHDPVYASGVVESLPAVSDFMHEKWDEEYKMVQELREQKFPIDPSWDGTKEGWESGQWTFVSAEPGLVLTEGKEIQQCLEKVLHFCRYDAYAAYDARGYAMEDQPDTLTHELLTAMNAAMRARSKRAAWEPLLGTPLPQLATIPSSADLIEATEEEWRVLRAKLRMCIARLAREPWITDMAATKVLYLKRPGLVPISDSYVRKALDISDPKWRIFPERGSYYAARAIEVAEAVRRVGRDNLPLLQAVQDSAKDAGYRLSKARIVDILVWVDMALANDPPHQEWNKKATGSGWDWLGKSGSDGVQERGNNERI